ncbi:NAD-dependent epimerase/dehydratase family protein [Chelatococcus asaccharovorans]|uniref:UDP-glucose 4-epimerase n=1 Tax=Chelatococcus asaccharovorans TaxID=28210 RepID=A0A2V3TWX8_9HYPH|nr:NAD-dependent epimerase/dehydratase family protein [Chelatococcus asaccharovorans]MBS7705183.1 NAD-dependent epimerase/dehydratase family protein [Chelatococcus asaccharovorans]PXW53681.1 UDP-glucose 4-epimerase [Chelatococcus asaccharovorans]
MKILITGGLGVNGSWVTREAIRRGHDVTVIDVRDDFSLMTANERAGLDFVLLDAGDLDKTAALMRERRIEAVIHMAAAVGSQKPEPDPYLVYKINTDLTARLLEASRLANVRRFVFSSSRAVYGPIAGEYQAPFYRPVSEDHPLLPGKLYDMCKVASEWIGSEFAASYAMEFVALRYAMIFGPGKTVRHGKFGTVSRMIEDAAAGVPVRIDVGGDQKDDMIFAEDVGTGTLLAVEAPKLNHTVYNICNGVGHTLNDVAAAIRAEIPGAEIAVGNGLNFLGTDANYSGILDPARAIADLGYMPRTDLRDCVRRYLAAIDHTGLLARHAS